MCYDIGELRRQYTNCADRIGAQIGAIRSAAWSYAPMPPSWGTRRAMAFRNALSSARCIASCRRACSTLVIDNSQARMAFSICEASRSRSEINVSRTYFANQQ